MLAYSSNASVDSQDLAACFRGDGGHAYYLRSAGGGGAQRYAHTLPPDLLRMGRPPAHGNNSGRRKQTTVAGPCPSGSPSGPSGAVLREGRSARSTTGTGVLSISLLASVVLSLGLAAMYTNIRALERRVSELTTSADLSARKMEAFRRDREDITDRVHERVNIAEGRLRRELEDLVRKEMWLLDNDKTGLVDFAQQSAGGRVVSTNDTVPYEEADSTLSFLGIGIYSMRSNDPSFVIQGDMSPGSCWAFRGSQGVVVVSLLGHVRLSAVSLQHISSSVAPTGAITSAPRDFSILGLDALDAPPVVLGKFTYKQLGPSLQFFRISENMKRSYRLVAMQVHSNHGHPQFTCVYRLRVHGSLDFEDQERRAPRPSEVEQTVPPLPQRV